MSADRNAGDDDLGERQQRFQREEMRAALRALLMTPLMDATHDDFGAVRRHADRLREWFARETGWILHVERDGARLSKRPADLIDATRGLPGYDRRRYVLLCLACAVLERAELAQQLGEQAQHLEAARQRLATGRSVRLSDLRELDVHAFEVLLGLLGETLGEQSSPDDTVARQTGDGLLHVRLEPLGAESRAEIATPHGVFAGRDHVITVTPVRDRR
jgi:hypothetical protein